MRLFLYLDEYKLYSFSSQLFRGLVDHVVKISERSRDHRDEASDQKETARIVAEIASEGSTVAEKKFLHDYAYDLFENQLKASSALVDVGPDACLTDFQQPKFIRVSGPGIFADAPSIHRTMEKFNPMAEALAYVTQNAAVVQAKAEVNQALATTTDRNKRERGKQALQRITPKALAETMGIRQDDEFLKQLTYLLKYGYGDQFHVQIPFSCNSEALLFTAVLNRQALRESEDLLLQKYSRLTDRSLVMVGVPTQAGGPTAEAPSDGSETLRAAMAAMIGYLSGMESQFTGRMEREIVLDPIAIYVQWDVTVTT